MNSSQTQTDFVVVGGGIAGLRAAIDLAEAGRVLVVTKQELTESNTQYAQGGIAVALSDEDEVSLHLQDTIDAGDGLVNVEAARILVEEGPPRIQELIQWGTEFDREGTRLSFTREGAHSRSRILHAHGDSTGREIGRALAAKAKTLSNIQFLEFEFTADVWKPNDRVEGVVLIRNGGERHVVGASAVLLASGGAGQVYSDTTNPSVATGDGIAMAHRVGAALSDMEFFQFHPTALSLPGAPRFLLSEALRGEGALLLNPDRKRFMPAYHPRAELAPRDVVARAIVGELESSKTKPAVAYLDMRHLNADHVRTRFPRIQSTCLQYGLDITRDLIPVRPAAHYLMGGVATDLDGRSSVPGLYAAGEAACTGVHGANRLASNSLLEGLVFGARAARAMRDELRSHRKPSQEAADRRTAEHQEFSSHLPELQSLMWSNAGVVRDGAGLQSALEKIECWQPLAISPRDRQQMEAANLLTVAELICRSALARKESRGAHFRTDFPEHDDVNFKKHSLVIGQQVSFGSNLRN
jgi:L-aspartate oxidase